MFIKIEIRALYTQICQILKLNKTTPISIFRGINGKRSPMVEKGVVKTFECSLVNSQASLCMTPVQIYQFKKINWCSFNHSLYM